MLLSATAAAATMPVHSFVIPKEPPVPLVASL